LIGVGILPLNIFATTQCYFSCIHSTTSLKSTLCNNPYIILMTNGVCTVCYRNTLLQHDVK